MIHSTAIVASPIKDEQNCQIGPFCIIEKGVQIGNSVILDSNVVLKTGVVIGDNVHIHSHVVLGDVPQIVNQKFDFVSGVVIGDNTVIREGVTVHRASTEGQATKVGNNCFLMAFSHVGHDTKVGNSCILANQVLLAGCVVIQDHVFLSGGSMVHQFVHIGESAFVSGNAEITIHVPPFTTVLNRNSASNINIVGLQRRCFSSEEIADIKRLYRYVYNGQDFSFKKKAKNLLDKQSYKTGKGKSFLEFFVEENKENRGFVYPKS